VDAGNMIFSPVSLKDPNALKLGAVKADLFIQAYNLMEYDAFIPGELDLALGVKKLISLRQQARFPFLLANLLDSKTRKPVFQPYRIREVNGFKMGILGLLSSSQPLNLPPEEAGGYYLEDPIKTAKFLVPELKKKCRVIVVFGQLGAEEQADLARKVPGIHLLLGGPSSSTPQEPVHVGESRIFNGGERGEHLGRVDITLQGRKIRSQSRLVALDTSYPDHPAILERIEEYKNRLQAFLEKMLAAAPAGVPASSPAGERGAEILFLGDRHCLPCHQTQHQSWMQTAHAKAFQTLEREKKSSDPGCLPCHTTGFGSPRESGASLNNVQCEACHGAGQGHPEKRETLMKVSEVQCHQCHNRANSPTFDYSVYREKIRHTKP
jgi:hypothetical protein